MVRDRMLLAPGHLRGEVLIEPVGIDLVDRIAGAGLGRMPLQRRLGLSRSRSLAVSEKKAITAAISSTMATSTVKVAESVPWSSTSRRLTSAKRPEL